MKEFTPNSCLNLSFEVDQSSNTKVQCSLYLVVYQYFQEVFVMYEHFFLLISFIVLLCGYEQRAIRRKYGMLGECFLNKIEYDKHLY